MNYRRKARQRRFRLLFALGLLVLGIVLPFASAVLAPPGRSIAAALPTAQLRMATPQPAVVALAQPALNDQLPAVAQQPDAITATAALAQPAVMATAAAPAAAPPAEPTLTSTPIPLAPVEGAAPIATLFPTVAADVPQEPLVSSAPPPILMYHYIRAVDQGSDPLGYELSVTPEDFGNQMAWLHDQGYIAMRMDGITRCVRGEALCPARAIALTFDDGYEDAYTEALPVLQRYGLLATFYIVTNFVGQPGYMTWEQVAALRDAGMEIGAHTVSHLDLTSLDWDTASFEIGQSKAELDRRLGINVTSFCYPTGLYNGTLEEQVRAAGFANATTTRWDNDNSDVMALPRRRISGGTALDGFAWIVQG
ncbi:MAG TPA: polysaccharide deacetylase family protein [Roseiflexaceae bacterium]|nr:polysaccharide deacetylase family protein [Roseiflexaceae bacterium]